MNIQVKKIAENVYNLKDEAFPLYLIKGEKNALIDCSVLPNASLVEEQIDSVISKKILNYVCLTHSHYDHTGACSVLQKRYGFSIICSNRTKEILENPDAIDFINNMNQKFKRMKNIDSDSVFTMPEKTLAVREGDKVQIDDNQSINIFETPGHTKCSITFQLKPQNVLFCGDAAGIIERNGKIKPLFLSSYLQYEESLKKLSEIDAEILALPHNTYIKGKNRIKAFFEQSLAETSRVKNFLLRLRNLKRPVEEIAEDILMREFPESSVMGPREAMIINIIAMYRAVTREFPS